MPVEDGGSWSSKETHPKPRVGVGLGGVQPLCSVLFSLSLSSSFMWGKTANANHGRVLLEGHPKSGRGLQLGHLEELAGHPEVPPLGANAPLEGYSWSSQGGGEWEFLWAWDLHREPCKSCQEAWERLCRWTWGGDREREEVGDARRWATMQGGLSQWPCSSCRWETSSATLLSCTCICISTLEHIVALEYNETYLSIRIWERMLQFLSFQIWNRISTLKMCQRWENLEEKLGESPKRTICHEKGSS